MRSQRLVILVVLLAALMVPVCTTFGGGKPRAILDQGVIEPANLVFPGTTYDNIYTQAAAAAGGNFMVNQAASNKRVVVQFAVDGLEANSTYAVYIDLDGIDEAADIGDSSTAGPWQPLHTFTTDATGGAAWYYQSIELLPGTYCWTVCVNKITYGRTGKIVRNYTILMSENLDFTIEL